VGVGNHYGHPSPEIMDALAERKIQIFRTDQDGTVVLATDGRTLRIRTDQSSFELSAGPVRPN
jgi:competence protein ComEC